MALFGTSIWNCNAGVSIAKLQTKYYFDGSFHMLSLSTCRSNAKSKIWNPSARRFRPQKNHYIWRVEKGHAYDEVTKLHNEVPLLHRPNHPIAPSTKVRKRVRQRVAVRLPRFRDSTARLIHPLSRWHRGASRQRCNLAISLVEAKSYVSNFAWAKWQCRYSARLCLIKLAVHLHCHV